MLDLSNVSLIGQNRQNLFFGDSLRYASRDELQIQTSLYSLQNSSGSSPILLQLSGFNKTTEDYQGITLNNVNYLGICRVNSVNYGSSNDVRIKPVNINLTIFQTGNISSFDSGNPFYSGIRLDNVLAPIHLIDSFSENFDVNISEDGTYSENQKIDLKFISGAAIGNVTNPLDFAFQFASNLFNSNAPIGCYSLNGLYSGWQQKPGKRTSSEVINLIENSLSVSRAFRTLRDISGSYSINYNNSLNIDEAGFASVKEAGRIQGLVPDASNSYFPAATSGLNYEVGNFSFIRCQNLFNSYVSASSYPLSSQRLTFGQQLNPFTDIASYSVEYSNNPKFNSLYSHEFTNTAERENGGCTYRISQDGSVVGISNSCNPAEKYSNALVAYSGIKTGIYSGVYNFYTGFSNFANPIKLVENSESQNKIQGSIKYNFVYSDNLLYSYSGVKKMSISVEDDYSTLMHNDFSIGNYKTIAQANNIYSLSKRNLTVDMNGFRGTKLTGYQNIAINTINSYIPTNALDPYIDKLEYSLDELNNKFNIGCSWTFQPSGFNVNSFLV